MFVEIVIFLVKFKNWRSKMPGMPLRGSKMPCIAFRW
nr:MAG TPA: hypothetical protein [Caudoviricetes sp.]